MIVVDHTIDDDQQPVVRKCSQEAAGRARLGHEAIVLGAGRHPGVVEVRRFTEEDGSGVTVLDLVPAGGRTLETLGRRRAGEAAGIVASLATTVADLHELGIVHHRIDRSHVVISDRGLPVLCGFGGATIPGPSGAAGPADAAVDVHGLGLLLGELVGTDGALEPIPDRRWGRRPRWHGYQARVLLNLADHATQDDPARRPSARALAAAIHESLPDASLPTLPTRPSPSRELPARRALPSTGRRGRPARPPRLPATAPAAPGASGWAASLRPLLASDHAPAPPDQAPRPSAVRPRTVRRLAAQRGTPGRSREPAAPGAGEPARPRPPRHLRLPAGLVGAVALVATVAGVIVATGVLGRPRAVDDEPGRSRDRPVAALAPTRCPAVVGPSAAIDGAECGQPVVVRGRVLSVGSSRFTVGRDGDEVVVGNWGCQGGVTPAVVRPSTGEVFVFHTWGRPGQDVTVRPTAVVERAIAPVVSTTAGSPCASLAVRRLGGPPIVVPTGGRS